MRTEVHTKCHPTGPTKISYGCAYCKFDSDHENLHENVVGRCPHPSRVLRGGLHGVAVLKAKGPFHSIRNEFGAHETNVGLPPPQCHPAKLSMTYSVLIRFLQTSKTPFFCSMQCLKFMEDSKIHQLSSLNSSVHTPHANLRYLLVLARQSQFQSSRSQIFKHVA